MLDPHIKYLNNMLHNSLERAATTFHDQSDQLHAAKLVEHYARALAALSPPKSHIIVEWSGGAVSASQIAGVQLAAADPKFKMVWRVIIDMRGDNGNGRHVLKFDNVEADARAAYTRILAEWRGAA